MSPNRLKHRANNAKSRAIRQEFARFNLSDVCWMARQGELLPPSPVPIDDPQLSSRLYGPSMKTVQLERIEVIELNEEGRVIWRA